MKTRIIVENVRVHQAEKGVFNQPSLSDIEFVYKNRVVKVDPKVLEDFTFTGLSNIDFVMDIDWDKYLDEDSPELKTASEVYFEQEESEVRAICNQGSLTQEELKEKYKDFIDDGPYNGIIPNNANDAIDEIMATLTTANIEDIKHMDDYGHVTDIIDDREIRNRWRLWGDSTLSRWFAEQGIYHPDDMSQLIIKGLWCKLHGDVGVVDMETEVHGYSRYWAGYGVSPEMMKEEFEERCKKSSDS